MGSPTVVEVVNVEASCRFLHVSATLKCFAACVFCCIFMCSPNQLRRIVASSPPDEVEIGAAMHDLELQARELKQP